MIKRALILMLIFLIVPGVFAITTDLRQGYHPGETAIVEISGNILEPIFKDNVKFLRGHVEVPFEYDVKKLSEKYYLWMVLSDAENNYTLELKDISTSVSGKVQKIDYLQNFSVVGNLTDYSVKPGAIIAGSDFELIVQLNEDEDKIISLDFPVSGEFKLKPGENNLKFSIAGKPTGFILINVGKYSIPVYILGKDVVAAPEFRFSPRMIESVVLIDEKKTYPFYIINSGNEDIGNVFIDYDENKFIVYPKTANITANGVQYYNMTVKELPEEGLDGVIYARWGNSSIDMIVQIRVTENVSEVGTPYLKPNYTESAYYCSELGGKFCTAGEICSADVRTSIDGPNCCVGTCAQPNKARDYSWIAYLIGGIILIVVILIGARYYKARGEKNPFAKRVSMAEEKL